MKAQACNSMAARLLRPSWAEIDGGAIAFNLAAARRLIGANKHIYFVCKGDGFGFGAASVGLAAQAAGVDAICAGSPEEVEAMRAAGVSIPILLFASTLPSDLPVAAHLGTMVTIPSEEALEAALSYNSPINAFIEIDSGFGRFGFVARQWESVFRRLSQASNIVVKGIYSHLSSPADEQITADQKAVFDAALAIADKFGFERVVRMIASSRVMIHYPEWSYNAVDPGRFIYGALDGPYMRAAGLRPLLSAIRGRIIHIQTHPAGTMLGIGYGAPVRLESEKRLAIVPIGFWDGLNHVPPACQVIVDGQYANVVGRRSFQHTVIDVSDIPTAKIGTVVTLLGKDGASEITIDELAKTFGVPVMEAIPRLARALPHLVLG